MGSNKQTVLETAVKTRTLSLLSDEPMKDLLRHSLAEGQTERCYWKSGVKMMIMSILGYQEELVRLCKFCYKVFRGSTQDRERKRPGQIMKDKTWQNGGQRGIKGVRKM